MSLQPWLPAQDSPEVPVNENFAALQHMAVYAKDPLTTTGLTWGYLGGRWGGIAVTQGTLTLAPSSTLYVTVNRATGVISVSSTEAVWNDLASNARAYKLTTGTATVLEHEDWRSGTGGVHGVAASGALLASLADVSMGTPADGQALVYSAVLGKWTPGAGGGSGGGGRTLLAASRTYYVSPAGSDSANGLSEATAFASLAKAEAVVTGTLDLGGFDVTVKLADGTYTAGVTLRRLTGSGNAIVEGNAAAPGNVIVNVAAGDAVRVDGSGADWQVRNFRVSAAAGVGLEVRNGAWVRHSGMVFGACSTAHIQLQSNARANCSGNYTIAAAAPIHVRQYSGTNYTHNGTAIAVSAAVAFSNAFFYSTGGFGMFKNYTLTGSAMTGKRYTLEALAMLDAGGSGATFPGNAAGTLASGSQII